MKYHLRTAQLASSYCQVGVHGTALISKCILIETHYSHLSPRALGHRVLSAGKRSQFSISNPPRMSKSLSFTREGCSSLSSGFIFKVISASSMLNRQTGVVEEPHGELAQNINEAGATAAQSAPLMPAYRILQRNIHPLVKKGASLLVTNKDIWCINPEKTTLWHAETLCRNHLIVGQTSNRGPVPFSMLLLQLYNWQCHTLANAKDANIALFLTNSLENQTSCWWCIYAESAFIVPLKK